MNATDAIGITQATAPAVRHAIVALIGEQPLPNLLPLLHLRPDAVLLVATERTRRLAGRLTALLDGLMHVVCLETDPYRIPVIEEAIEKELSRPAFTGAAITFNLTGGTKPMTLAAYTIAQQRQAPVFYLQSEGRASVVYAYTWQAGNLQLNPPQPEVITVPVDLTTVLRAHLDTWDITGPSKGAGGVFEAAVAAALRADPRFDEVLLGVHALGGQIDIDVLVRSGDQVGIIEAKAGNAGGRLDGVKQLNTARRTLGTYTAPLYVISRTPTTAQQPIVDAMGITTIALMGYNGGRILSDALRTMLADAVYQRLRG